MQLTTLPSCGIISIYLPNSHLFLYKIAMIEEFERPLSLVEAIMNSIRSSIINGDLSLGQQLTESYLHKTFGFSKTPVRDALAQLKAEGIVVAEVNKGFRVFKMDEKELSEFCEYRLALESQALKSAYNINRLELVRGLKKIVNLFKKSIKENDFVKYNLTDTKFHKSFFILSSNRYLINNYDNINSIIETIRTQSGAIFKNAGSYSIKGHISIFKHIEEKNLNMALNELDNHINSWHDDRIIKSSLIT
jgi:DNA-binding GntR family transcriptional regulator